MRAGVHWPALTHAAGACVITSVRSMQNPSTVTWPAFVVWSTSPIVKVALGMETMPGLHVGWGAAPGALGVGVRPGFVPPFVVLGPCACAGTARHAAATRKRNPGVRALRAFMSEETPLQLETLTSLRRLPPSASRARRPAGSSSPNKAP